MFNNFSVQVDLRPHFEKHWSSCNRSDVTRTFHCWLEPPAMVSSPAHKAAPSHFSKFSLVPNPSQSLTPLSSGSFLWSYTEKSNISPIMMTLYICFYFIILSVIFFFHFLAMLRACEILVPYPGIEPMLPALEAQSPNHWTIREDSIFLI